MPLRIPGRDDLHRLAQSNYFTLSNEEVEAYHSLMAVLFPLFDQLDQMPEPHAPRRYPTRDPGQS